MQESTVLILSEDAMIGALLGAWAEAAGFRPMFLTAAEQVSAVLERERPQVLLVDVDHPDGMSAGVLARARLAGMTIILFSPRRSADEVRVHAEQRGVRWLRMPLEHPEFAALLEGSRSVP